MFRSVIFGNSHENVTIPFLVKGEYHPFIVSCTDEGMLTEMLRESSTQKSFLLAVNMPSIRIIGYNKSLVYALIKLNNFRKYCKASRIQSNSYTLSLQLEPEVLYDLCGIPHTHSIFISDVKNVKTRIPCFLGDKFIIIEKKQYEGLHSDLCGSLYNYADSKGLKIFLITSDSQDIPSSDAFEYCFLFTKG